MAQRFDDDRTLRDPSLDDSRPHLPSVDALVGADAPCEPIPPPPEDRSWDAESGRWIRNGVAVPPDPAHVTYPPPPSPDEQGLGFSSPSVGSSRIAPDLADAPVPRWAVAFVGAMFLVGIGLGVLFTLVK